jgi:Zn-dependent M28 family amino/carboxypeptidase
VVGVLEEKGYEVSTQSFQFPFFEELAPTQLARIAPTPQTYERGTDFAVSETRTTRNVIADTPGGDPSKVVVVGAHLDSVPEGPGIVDNGSGTATVLEIARRLNEAANIHKTGGRGLRNKVRFAFWGAEEFGLRGSRFCLAQLTQAQRATISLNLNADMIASSNFVYFVQDGDGSTFGVAGLGRSAEAERVFLDFFAGRGLPTVPRELDGRSDWQAFNEVGIG